MMLESSISFGIVNYDLADRTLSEARELVQIGEARWVRAPLATLKLVPPSYQLPAEEVFVQESAPNHFIPL